MRLILIAVLCGLVFGLVGCQTISVDPDPSAATVVLKSAECWFWRMGQGVSVEFIDGRTDPSIEGDKLFKLTPGKHTMHLAYYAEAGGRSFVPTSDLKGNVVTIVVGSSHYWHNIFDEQDIAFEVEAGKVYRLLYDVKQWPTPHKLRLKLIDLDTKKAIADSGVSGKTDIMPIRMGSQ